MSTILKHKMLLTLLLLHSLIHFSTAVVNEEDVTFRLFTRSNPQNYVLLNTTNLKGINIDVSIEFKIVTHGYYSSADTDWMLQIKDSYLQKKACNVILIDWSKPAQQIYSTAAADTQTIGKLLGNLIIALNTEKENLYRNIHLIGHSLGAHLHGFAGKHVINTVGAQIWRISAMDAAGPLFIGSASDQRLSVGDASFIDAIHTDSYKFGYADPIADIDFYPNGGLCPHSGCATKRKRDLRVDLTNTMSVSCCHSISHVFTNEAIFSNRFNSTKCESYTNYLQGLCRNNPTTLMGENVDINARGTYYLTTNYQSPYAKG